jgi:cyclopropane fatty-acyl-phospholipid synthase-like methyltransferase
MNPKEIVKVGYDKAGLKYTATRREELEEMNFLPEFAEFIPPGGAVLDLGCGAGIPFTKYLSDRYKVTGVDISPNQIKLAQKNVPNAEFSCLDMTKIDFPEEKFDGILAYYSIIHVPRDEHFGLFQTMFKILKPKGVALMSLHQIGDRQQVENNFFGATMYWSGWSKNQNLHLLTDAGFKIIWEKLIPDSLDGDHEALFVFVQKPI